MSKKNEKVFETQGLGLEQVIDRVIEKVEAQNIFRKNNNKEQKRLIVAHKVLHRFLERKENEKYAKYWTFGQGRSIASVVFETITRASGALGLSLQHDKEEEGFLSTLYQLKETPKNAELLEKVLPQIFEMFGLTQEFTKDEKEVLKKQKEEIAKADENADDDLAKVFDDEIKKEQERLESKEKEPTPAPTTESE